MSIDFTKIPQDSGIGISVMRHINRAISAGEDVTDADVLAALRLILAREEARDTQNVPQRFGMLAAHVLRRYDRAAQDRADAETEERAAAQRRYFLAAERYRAGLAAVPSLPADYDPADARTWIVTVPR